MNCNRLTATLCASVLALFLSACGQGQTTSSTDTSYLSNASKLFSSRDTAGTYDASAAVKITLADGQSSCNSSAVAIDGDTLTVTGEGTYILSGSLSEGQLIVDAPGKKVQLVLSDVTIANTTSAALYVRQADKVFLTLAEGSANTLSSTSAFVAIDGNNINAAVYSKDDLTINGTGNLTVSCAYGHGISSKDDLCITGGTLAVSAAKHALAGKDSVRISGGTFTLTAGKDGIHSEDSGKTEKGFIYIGGGSFAIACGDDGIHAGTDLVIRAGELTISESEEGLEGKTITIDDGNLSVTASDDGLNATNGGSSDAGAFPRFPQNPMEYSADNWIVINGGTLYVNAGGDGIDSNGNFTLNGGTVCIDGPVSNGNSPLDWGGEGIINGGTLIAVGSSAMAEAFSESCTQGAMLVTFSSVQSGTVVLSASDGTELLSHTAAKEFSCASFSCPAITTGNTYTVSCGGNTVTIEMTGIVYGSGMGGFPNGPGGMGRPGLDGKHPDFDGKMPDFNGR